MPPVVAAAAIGGAAALGGSYLQSRAANKATTAQQKANDAALAHAQQQEAQRRADYDRAYQDWLNNRQQLLARYGLSAGQPVGSRGNTGITGGAGGPGPMRASNPGQVYVIPFPGQQQPSLTNAPRRVAENSGRPGSLADVMANRQAQALRASDWNDWRMYGLPS